MMNKNHWCHIKKKILNILDMEIERFILEQHLKTQKASKIDDYTKKKKNVWKWNILCSNNNNNIRVHRPLEHMWDAKIIVDKH